MKEEAKTYSIEESPLLFAKTLNGKVRDLLQKTDRSKSESERIIYAAQTSWYHWFLRIFNYR